jgi:hypothetical protein
MEGMIEEKIEVTTKRGRKRKQLPEDLWISHMLRSNYLLEHVMEGKIEEKIEVTTKRGRKSKQLPDDLKETAGCMKLKEERVHSSLRRAGLAKSYDLLVRRSTKCVTASWKAKT